VNFYVSTIKRIAVAAVLTAGAVSSGALGGEPLRPRVKPPEPAFNRLYHNDQIIDFLRGYERAYPRWVKLESLGETLGGSETWLLTVNNPDTGDELTKPAMYVDGAIHANEAQAAETVLYLIDYMLRNYGRLPKVTEAMDRSAFYFIPIVSPDSRAKWFEEPATPSYPRTVQIAIDDDRDGRKDEDHYNDLNDDNEITQMRKKVPMGQGTHRLHPDDPRIMERVSGKEQGGYILLGSEGIDDDGDGRINEDPIGYVDPNRTWGYFWQPRYVQSGTTQYPLQIPETRNIAEWMLTRPNIAAGQSFHNTGRMILRGPGAKSEPDYPPQDIRVYDYLGEEGENLLPGYNYWVIWEDLYTVYGGTINHLYGVHGAISFTNELYGPEQDFDGDGRVSQEERMKFNDRLALGRMFVEWEEVEHPQYGTVEVGGFRKDTGRVPEGWMLEEECHRNAAFVLFHARHLPKISINDVETEQAGQGLWKVYVTLRNDRAIPSVTEWARRNKLHRMDLLTLDGAEVVASGEVRNRWTNEYSLQEHRPERLVVPGVDGFETKVMLFLVEGEEGDDIEIVYDSEKAGRLETSATLGD